MLPTLSVITKANLESQLALIDALRAATLESFGKVSELNIAAAKASVQDSCETMQSMIREDAPQDVFTLAAEQIQPTASKAFSYGHHLLDIASHAQSELSIIAQKQLSEGTTKIRDLVNEATKEASNPVQQSAAAFGLVKNTIEENVADTEKKLFRETKRIVESTENSAGADGNKEMRSDQGIGAGKK